MIYYAASFLTIGSGLILFGLGMFGLLGPDYLTLRLHLITHLLIPMGFDPVLDTAYLGLIAVLGFWLTLGVYVRIPAAITLGAIIGKLLLVNNALAPDNLLKIGLSLLAFAVLMRMITNTSHARHDRITPYMFRFW